MKKNKMMRIASVLLVAVLLSTCAISGTFAKYTTTATTSDSARVAKWGFNTASINFEDLFAASYSNVAAGSDETAIIAPGTKGEVAFKFENATTAPEVAYSFTVSTTGSTCDQKIEDNVNITWALAKTDEKASAVYGTWDELIAKLEALDGDKTYAAGEIPIMVDTEYTILWNWAFENTNDGNADSNAAVKNDSWIGNEAVAGDITVTLQITITATQID
ncbi:MAG: hypothetical protein IJD35_05125 [Clostridia bacterium]|nr:hypothetical protein [Clostridia bacterium]